MTDNHPLRIALWGPSAAGKTMLIVQLYNEQAKYPQEGWQILLTEDSSHFIQSCRKEVSGGNAFLPATARGTLFRCTYHFRNTKTGREAMLSIDDRAGGDLVDLSPEVRKHLREAQGLVLLFDPSQVRRENEEHILRMLEWIQIDAGNKEGKYPHPIAVCLSKADLLLETVDDVDFAHRNPEDFARKHVGTRVLDALDRLCDDFRFFPVSSVGVQVRHGFVRRAVFYDEQLRLRLREFHEPAGARRSGASQVLNPMAPFSWLFGALEAQ